MPNGFLALRPAIFLHRFPPSNLSYRNIIRIQPYSMPATTSGVSPPNSGVSARKLKILMLHGYTQSGALFHAKTRALEKLLIKAFPSTPSSPLYSTFPGGVQLFYPTAPIRLLPADIPGYSPASETTEEESDAWGWWRRETGGEKYVGLEDGLSRIAETIKEAGGIDGVIGFSQGGAAAGFVASLLDPERPAAFAAYAQEHSDAPQYPESFSKLRDELGQGQLRFAVSYSGFAAPASLYRAFYEPKIQTKVLHVIGSLDSVVEEKRSLMLVDSCEGGKERVLYHPGGHFVPISKDVTGVLVGFIRECCEVKKVEESVEDMDMPF